MGKRGREIGAGLNKEGNGDIKKEYRAEGGKHVSERTAGEVR